MKYLSFFIFSIGLISVNLFGASGDYTGPDPGVWEDNGNWSGATFPNGTNDVATFTASVAEIDISSAIEVQGVVINDPGFTVALDGEGANPSLTFTTEALETTLNQGTLSVSLPIIATGTTQTTFANGATLELDFNGASNSLAFDNDFNVFQSGSSLAVVGPTGQVQFSGASTNSFENNASFTVSSSAIIIVSFEGTSNNIFSGGSTLTFGGFAVNAAFDENSINTFSGDFEHSSTNDNSSVVFTGNSANTFTNGSTTTLSGGGSLSFRQESNNTFQLGSSLTLAATANGTITFAQDTPGTTNSFSGTVESASADLDAEISFLGVSENTFTNGSELILSNRSGISFTGASQNQFENGSTIRITNTATTEPRVGFLETSINTFEGAITFENQADGSVEFSDDTQNTFEATSVINIDVDDGFLRFSGNSVNTFNAGSAINYNQGNGDRVQFFGFSQNSFNGDITFSNTQTDGSINFFGNSQNDFGTTTITLPGGATNTGLFFQGSSENTFGNGATLNFLSGGGSAVVFDVNSVNTFGNGSTLTFNPAGNASLAFQGDSSNRFENGSTLIQASADALAFVVFTGSSVNSFELGSTLSVTGLNRVTFTGSSQNVFSGAVSAENQAGNNRFSFGGDSFNVFTPTSTLSDNAGGITQFTGNSRTLFVQNNVLDQTVISALENASIELRETTFANTTSLFIQGNARVFGTGTISSTTNSGTLQAGATAADTLNLDGTYTQQAGGRFATLVSGNQASSLNITGTATLAGTVQVIAADGVYPLGTTYEILDAAGGITDTFSAVTFNTSGDWGLRYTPNTVLLVVTQTAATIPASLSSLRGNSRRVADYLYGSPQNIFFNGDSSDVGLALGALSPENFADSLIKISPLATAGISMVNFRSNVEMAVVLDKQFNAKVQKKLQKRRARKVKRGELLCSALPKTGWFIEPIVLYYNQRQVDGPLAISGQIGFDAMTYGFGTGWEQLLGKHFVFEAGAGYTHSNLKWEDDFGHAEWSSIYLAPFVGWYNDTFYANMMIMGALNLNYYNRNIRFPGIDRTAKADYLSYDILLRANGGARFHIDNGFWIQPDATLNYLTTLTESYSERGANSLDLQVRRNSNFVLQPSVRAKLIKEFQSMHFCYTPNLYVGYLANILLNSQDLSSRFVQAPTQILFNTTGYYKTTHQLVLGAEYYMENPEKFLLSSTFEVDMLSKLEVYSLKIKFQLFF